MASQADFAELGSEKRAENKYETPKGFFLNHIIFLLWGTSYKKKYWPYIRDSHRSGDSFPSIMVRTLILCVFWIPLTNLGRLAVSLFQKRE